VRLHFKEKGDTMEDKILHLLQMETSQTITAVFRRNGGALLPTAISCQPKEASKCS